MHPSLRITALSALLLAALLPDGAESYGMATCSKPASAEMAWKDLSKKERKAAQALGFDYATWNFEKVLNMGSETLPEWKELSKTEKRVAQAQGWNKKSWKANPCDSNDCEETEFCFRGQCLDTSDNDTCVLISSLGRTDDGWDQSYLAQEDSNWQCPGRDEHVKRERRNGDDFPIRPGKDDWADLHWTAKSAAKQLGWTDETFDGCICTHADTALGDWSWEELNTYEFRKELKAFKKLGYNECSWDADYDSVKLIQKKWEELTQAETDTLKQLGLSKFKWNSCIYAQDYKEYSPTCYANGGISSRSPEIRRNWGKTKLWNALSWKQKEAAKMFGFTQDSWDNGYYWTDYNGDGEWEMAWGGLSLDQQTAAGTLGWVQETWDCEEDESALCIPDSIKKDYCQLTKTEKKNAKQMGLSPINWDMRGDILMEMPWGGAEIYMLWSDNETDSAPMKFGKSYKSGKKKKWVKAANALGWTWKSWRECQSQWLSDSEWLEWSELSEDSEGPFWASSEDSIPGEDKKVTCDGYTTDQFCDCSIDCDVRADTWCGCGDAQADDCCGMHNNTSAGSLEGPGPK